MEFLDYYRLFCKLFLVFHDSAQFCSDVYSLKKQNSRISYRFVNFLNISVLTKKPDSTDFHLNFLTVPLTFYDTLAFLELLDLANNLINCLHFCKNI